MFYAYDFGQMAARFRWEYDRFFYDRWCREALAALLNHPDRTDDPEQADFFVVTATLRCVPFAVVEEMGTVLHGHGIPFLSSGKPHVYFDLLDGPKPLIDDPQAIVCKSAFHQRYYDPKVGVPIPQFPRFRFENPNIPASQRQHLAGFKGDPRPQYGDLRVRLLALNDNETLVFKGDVFRPSSIEISPSGVVREIVQPSETSHLELLCDSTFAILPRACGYALSYRMIECMNAGCIPVVLSDGYVLPFSEEVDYDSFSIRVAEPDVEHLRDILMSRWTDVDRMQERVLQVYESHFASTERIIHQALKHVSQRVLVRSPSLTEIANRHACDKGTLVGLAGPPHGYTMAYERLLGPRVSEPLRLLEIGIYRGASLRMWYEYLPNANIFAFDRLDLREMANDRVAVFSGDQENRDHLKDLMDGSGSKFDVIIDDGGHHMSQQQVSLGCLFASLKPGGIYCIEDLHTSCDPAFGVAADGRNSTLAMLLKYRETGRFDSSYLTEMELASLNRWVDRVAFHCDNKLAVIYKKSMRIPSQRDKLITIRSRLRDTLLCVTPAELSEFSRNSITEGGSSPLVTVIIAVYNVEVYIAAALESCLNQTYGNVEVILVDDCSTDGTTAICEQYAAQYPRLRLLRNDRNLGVYVSRNRGFQAAQGEYLCWHDGDDLMHPDRLLWQYQATQFHKGAIASVARNRRMERIDAQTVFHQPVPNSFCPTLFFHRSILDQIGYFDSVRFMADREYFDRFITFFGIYRLVLVDAVVWDAWKRPNSLTTSPETGEGSQARSDYFHSFRAWHRSGSDLYIPFPLDQRPFPVADSILPEPSIDSTCIQRWNSINDA